jgi:hypothetical protein
MSHAATNWAIQQRGLKPTTKIVLWHLCDRFNPDYGCFPSQERLAHDCEISRSTLNDHLRQLEAAGLLRRVPRLHPITKRQMPTRYILRFEPGFTPNEVHPCPKTGHGREDHAESVSGTEPSDSDALDIAESCLNSGHGYDRRPVSDFPADPCPENSQSRVRNPDTNLVREPLREPVKEEKDARARENAFDDFFGKLLLAVGFDPDGPLPGWWQGWPPREHVRRWIEELGLTENEIVEAAKTSRQEHPEPPDGPKALDRVIQRTAQRKAASHRSKSSNGKTRQGKVASGPAPSIDELAAFYADRVNGDGYLPPSMISIAMCQAMLERGLVTHDQLRMRGVL